MTRVSLLIASPSENIEEFIVSTARTSTDSRKDDIRPLIRYLFRHQHLSPFEFANFTFEIECPIFVKNQIVRHRTAKFNERSLRYVQYEESFFRPSKSENGIRFKGSSNRQSSIPGDVESVREDFERIESKLDDILKEYHNLISKGVANEVARFCLPLATMTKFRISFDLRNLLHFLYLRTDASTQYETRIIANQMLELIRPMVPTVIEVWEDYSINSVVLANLDESKASQGEINEMKSKIESIKLFI